MRPIWQIFVVLTLVVPSPVLSETVAEDSAATRPGDPEGTLPVSDGLAECASILVAASGKSTNLIAKKKMQFGSRDWFATSGLLALEESGAVPSVEVWEEKVSDWSARIGSVEAMARHQDWMAYCTELGSSRGLDVSSFSAAAQ